jgi:predicted NUDIX family NTP pyrophosphohydrolase
MATITPSPVAASRSTSSRNVSAGLLMYRRADGGATAIEVLLAHPGGPFFRNKDDGFWTIPKGAPAPGEALEAAARREFTEELGLPVQGALIPIGEIRQKAGKVVHGWAVEGDLPPDFELRSNTFEVEWPPRSGRHQFFPEIDRAEFFTIDVARTKINAAQTAFLDRLVALVAGSG